MSPAVVKVEPSRIRAKISADLLTDGPDFSEYARVPLAESDKYRSVVSHYTDGEPWSDTPLFTNIYRTRLARGEAVRGCTTESALVKQYCDRVDALFADMRAHGFRMEAAPIPVYIAQDGAVIIGNQGNHRVGMAHVLGLPFVVAKIVAQHPDAGPIDAEPAPPELVGPELPECARAIPAMTTEEERRCYYRWTREAASKGAVVELGAWLGASTAYIAAAMRDSGSKGRAYVYDRFIWKPSSHDKKAGGRVASQLEAFRQNLGPLLTHVTEKAGELKDLKWAGGPVSLLVCDAPKRMPEIAKVLGAFADALHVGAVMAWQDFAYFPSYDIPAAMMRLGARVSFVEAVYPGTTAVFRVEQPWTAADVSLEALALTRWTPDEVEAAWNAWAERLPEPMRPRFRCGAAMFLCDLGATARAQYVLRSVLKTHPDDVLPKWRYLVAERANLMTRYRPLVEVLP